MRWDKIISDQIETLREQIIAEMQKEHDNFLVIAAARCDLADLSFSNGVADGLQIVLNMIDGLITDGDE